MEDLDDQNEVWLRKKWAEAYRTHKAKLEVTAGNLHDIDNPPKWLEDTSRMKSKCICCPGNSNHSTGDYSVWLAGLDQLKSYVTAKTPYTIEPVSDCNWILDLESHFRRITRLRINPTKSSTMFLNRAHCSAMNISRRTLN